jgi:hypothetical protein
VLLYSLTSLNTLPELNRSVDSSERSATFAWYHDRWLTSYDPADTRIKFHNDQLLHIDPLPRTELI